MNQYRKFFAALTPLIVGGLTSIGVDVPADYAMTLTALATPLLVWLVPNA